MNKFEISDELSSILAGIFIGFVLGAWLGIYQTISHYESLSIKHGCSQYNSTTGDFEWKEVEE